MTRLMTMSALLLSTACLEVKTDDTSSEPSSEASVEPSSEASGEPSSDTGVEPAEMQAWITWDGDSALLSLENASEDSIFYFGMAETKGAYTSTLDAEGAGAWTAEDCTGFSQQGDYCHEVPASSEGFAYLELINGSINDLTTTGDPQYTLFNAELAGDGMTYVLDDVVSGMCYVWGDMPAYYDDFAYACEYMPEWEM